jgi:hypothetical protein
MVFIALIAARRDRAGPGASVMVSDRQRKSIDVGNKKVLTL